MNTSLFNPLSGLLTSVPAALAGALGGAPWWLIMALFAATAFGLPLTGMLLEHSRQRKGNTIDEVFTMSLKEISDPQQRIQAIISYKQLSSPAVTAPAQPPPDPPPGAQPQSAEPPTEP